MTKHVIREMLSDNFEDQLSGDINDVITKLQTVRDKYKDYQYVSLSLDAGYNDVSVYLYGERLETDKEYNKRISSEKKKNEWSKAGRRKMYEKLKKEFEK